MSTQPIQGDQTYSFERPSPGDAIQVRELDCRQHGRRAISRQLCGGFGVAAIWDERRGEHRFLRALVACLRQTAKNGMAPELKYRSEEEEHDALQYSGYGKQNKDVFSGLSFGWVCTMSYIIRQLKYISRKDNATSLSVFLEQSDVISCEKLA